MRTARSSPRRTATGRLLAAALALLGALLLVTFAQPARAAGSVTIADRAPKEEDGRWKLKMTMDYGGVPHIGHIPMIFAFTPVVLYERALTDQSPEKPVLNKIPLRGQQSINESMDVGFADASGKVFKVTKFDFVLRRDRDFEAGEYDLKITRVSDGVQVGPTQKITLQGDNPIVDRRAIVFTGEKKKEKKAEGEGEKAAGEPAEEPAAEEPAPGEGSEAPVETPPSVEPQQGGCGCRVAGGDAGSPTMPASALAALALAAAASLRLRRRRTAA